MASSSPFGSYRQYSVVTLNREGHTLGAKEKESQRRIIAKESGVAVKDYDASIDGYRLSWLQKIGFIVLGFVAGVPGILIDWAIARRRKMMECSAEGIYLGIIGWALRNVVFFCMTVTGLGAQFSLYGATMSGWAVFGLVVSILFIVLSSMWVYGMRYKMTPAEKKRVLHGDDWIKPGEKHLRYDSAITINAAPEKIWPYIRQAGQERAGWYSFDWLERAFTFDIHNHYDIHPEWQELEAGHYQFFHQPPLTIGEWVTEASNDGPWYFASHSDTAVDPGYKNPGPNGEKALKLWFKRFCWTWNWEVVPVDATRSRLMWRCDCTFERYHRLNKYFVVFILGTASIVMGRNFMDVMKALCEGRLTYSENKR